MTKENAFRMVEDFIEDNLHENWDGLQIRINKITYNVFLGYGTGLNGSLALCAWLSIPDYDTAMTMGYRDYVMFDYINDRLKNIDFEHYF